MGISLVTYGLVVMFGSSSWLSTNSVWMELPLLTAQLPEQWSLPSYLAVIVQLACIGPIIYSVIRKCIHRDLKSPPLIAGMLAFGCVCTGLLALLWHQTGTVSGRDRSVALFLCFSGLALVNCTSNVLFMPYMAIFHHRYLTAYFVGMGLSALFPSVVSLIQGTGQFDCVPIWNDTATNSSSMVSVKPVYMEPRFGVTAYNLIMLVWMILALIAYILLHWTKLGSDETLKSKSAVVLLQTETKTCYNNISEASPLNDRSGQTVKTNNVVIVTTSNERTNTEEAEEEEEAEKAEVCTKTGPKLSPRHALCLLLLTAWICGLMNGVVPSLQSYASLPYGQLTYHLALTLSNIANPFACFIPFFVKIRSIGALSALTLLATLFSGYIILLAALSPDPILLGSVWGSFFCVLAAVLALGTKAYLRTAMAGLLQEDSQENSESRLFWCGAFTQLGSFLGAMSVFPLVSVYQLFKSAPPCR